MLAASAGGSTISFEFPKTTERLSGTFLRLETDVQRTRICAHLSVRLSGDWGSSYPPAADLHAVAFGSKQLFHSGL